MVSVQLQRPRILARTVSPPSVSREGKEQTAFDLTYGSFLRRVLATRGIGLLLRFCSASLTGGRGVPHKSFLPVKEQGIRLIHNVGYSYIKIQVIKNLVEQNVQ